MTSETKNIPPPYPPYRKELGKISSVRFGFGGYDDAQIGLSLSFSMKGSGVNTFLGTWSGTRSDRCKWTEEERFKTLGETVLQIGEWLGKIHGKDVHDLVGTPVELTFDGNMLKDWRLLEEVL
jgi:hypothetical protein